VTVDLESGKTVIFGEKRVADTEKLTFVQDARLSEVAEASLSPWIKAFPAKGKYGLLCGIPSEAGVRYMFGGERGKTVKFVFVARIMREKGIDEYLAAAKYFKENNYNVEFHVCGFCEKNYETYLDEYQEKNIIIYHGMVSNMHEIYCDMHCTIHPTFYPEGLSNVLLVKSFRALNVALA